MLVSPSWENQTPRSTSSSSKPSHKPLAICKASTMALAISWKTRSFDGQKKTETSETKLLRGCPWRDCWKHRRLRATERSSFAWTWAEIRTEGRNRCYTRAEHVLKQSNSHFFVLELLDISELWTIGIGSWPRFTPKVTLDPPNSHLVAFSKANFRAPKYAPRNRSEAIARWSRLASKKNRAQ